MFLEVWDEAEKPHTYRLSRLRIIVGSLPSNDIVISSKSVSKKHLMLINEDDHWYVVDQGSTNGSYINDEQLIPGKKMELSNKGQVRLGEKVVLMLLLEPVSGRVREIADEKKKLKEKAVERLDQDKTMVISLDQFQADQAKAAEIKRKERIARKRAENAARKSEQKRLFLISTIALFIIALGVVLNNSWRKGNAEAHKDTILKKMQGKTDQDQEIDAEINGMRIPRKELISRSELMAVIASSKCEHPMEETFCNSISLMKSKKNGVLWIEPSIVFFVDKKEWFEGAGSALNSRSDVTDRLIGKVAFLNFIREYSENIRVINHESTRFYVVFYSSEEDDKYWMDGVGAIKSEIIPLLLGENYEEKLDNPELTLESIFEKMDYHFTYY